MSFWNEVTKAPIDLRSLSYAETFTQTYQASGFVVPGTSIKLWPRLSPDSGTGEIKLILDPLKYPRPDLSTYHTVDVLSNTQYKIDGGATQSYGTSITLPNTTEDYWVRCPSGSTLGKKSGLTINRGRNIAAIGGEIDFSNILTAPFGAVNYDQTNRRALQFSNFTGDVYVEGMWIHGNQICDGIWYNPSVAAVRKFTVQNCLIEGMACEDLAAQDAGVHPDVIQWQNKSTSVYAGLTNYIYQLVGRTAYQGFTTNDNFPLFEQERVYLDLETVRNWDNSKRSGYAYGFFAPDEGTVHLRTGPDVVIRTATGQYVGPVYPEQMPGWQQMTMGNTLTDPAWTTSFPTPGRTYAANMPRPVVVAAGDLAAHMAATTSVHGIPNTASLPITVNHGGNANTARPSWSGVVMWSGTVTPNNAITGDIVVVS